MIFNDIYEYYIFLGMTHRETGKPINIKTLVKFNKTVYNKAINAYLLGYEISMHAETND